jgi:hypothetical protein
LGVTSLTTALGYALVQTSTGMATLTSASEFSDVSFHSVLKWNCAALELIARSQFVVES